MQDKKLQNKNYFLKILHFFDKITSNHGHDYLLALSWIFVFELISSLVEYIYLDVAQNYIYHIPESFVKEIVIALLIIIFVWYCVYLIISMKRNIFIFLALYFSLGIYLIITHDVTFNLLSHNIINPFEFEFNSFGFYVVAQIFIKLITIYLIYMFFISLKNKKSK